MSQDPGNMPDDLETTPRKPFKVGGNAEAGERGEGGAASPAGDPGDESGEEATFVGRGFGPQVRVVGPPKAPTGPQVDPQPRVVQAPDVKAAPLPSTIREEPRVRAVQAPPTAKAAEAQFDESATVRRPPSGTESMKLPTGIVAASKAPPARLVFVFKGMRRAVDLEMSPFSVGRDEKCSQSFVDSVVSQRHGEISFDEKGYFLEDLGSKNGTYLEEEKLAPKQKFALSSGAFVRFAAVEALFLVEKPGAETGPTAEERSAAQHLVRKGRISADQVRLAAENAATDRRSLAEKLLLSTDLSVREWMEVRKKAHSNPLSEALGAVLDLMGPLPKPVKLAILLALAIVIAVALVKLVV